MRARAVGAGIAGGLVAGALVGAAEAVLPWLHAHGTGELPPLAWALGAYGAVGAVGGFGLGVLAALLGLDGFGLAFAPILAVLTFVFGRFRIVRDVFLEQMPKGPVALAAQLGALLGVVVVAFLLWRALRGADARRRPLTRPLVAAVLVAVFAAAWTAFVAIRPHDQQATRAETGTAPADAPNVVLFMVDTLRADHLSCYGYADSRTPSIDRLAADGMRYAHAFSQASWTRPSVATILTGLYPSSHGAIHKADILPNRVTTLAEALQAGGYHTVGFANNANVSAVFNFQQGFDDYRYLAPDFFFGADEPAAQLALYNVLRLVHERFLSRSVNVHNYYQPAETVVGEVTRWLDRQRGQDSRPFFLFVHLMDAHDPYMVHPFNGEGYARVALPNPPPEMSEKLRRLYDGEIAYLDQHLGTLLDDLRRRGLYDKTLVILTADHGEEFHEHGGWWHGTTLYDEQTHVPLIVKPPGGAEGRVLEEMATSLDIAPTILTAAQLPVVPEMQGHALPLDGGVPPSRQAVFSEEDLEGNVLQAVRTPQWKFITANPGNPRGLAPEELYDLGRDPGEKRDVTRTATAEAETMRAELGKSILTAREHSGAAETTAGNAASTERLRALGYVQ